MQTFDLIDEKTRKKLAVIKDSYNSHMAYDRDVQTNNLQGTSGNTCRSDKMPQSE